MSREFSILNKYRLFCIVMTVLLLFEYYLPYDNKSINIVFFGIAFLRIIICLLMEHSYSKEKQSGKDYIFRRALMAIETYFYLVVFIVDVQASFTFSRSLDNVASAYKFFVFTWIMQFLFGTILAFLHTERGTFAKSSWIIISAILIKMLIGFLAESAGGHYSEGVDFAFILFVIRSVIWFLVTRPKKSFDKEFAGDMADEPGKMGEEAHSVSRLRAVFSAMVLLIYIGAAFYLYGYEYGDQYVLDESGNKVASQGFAEVYAGRDGNLEGMAQYMVHNRWPKNSPFYREKFGIVDLNTGEYTAPVFDGALRFQDDGLAWDYKGNYVDRKGDIVVTNHYFIENDTVMDNPLKFSLYAFDQSVVRGKNTGYLFEKPVYLRNPESMSGGVYNGGSVRSFSNGYAAYRIWPDSFNSQYHSWGYINMDGEIVIEPTFQRASDFDENGYAIVGRPMEYDGDEIEYGIIGKDFGSTHEYVLSPDGYTYISLGKNGSYTAYKYVDGKEVAAAVMDSEGNITYN